MNLIWVDAYVIGLQGVNLRKSAGKTRTVLKLIPTGAALKICEQLEDVAEGYRWVLAAYSTDNGNSWLYGFVAKALVKVGIAPTPIPEPPKPPPYKTIGLHFAGSGDIGDLLGVAKRLAENKTPIPCMVIVNDGGLCSAVKQVSPSTYIVFRGNVQGGGEGSPFENLRDDGSGIVADPVAWYQHMDRFNSQAAGADAFSLYNERTFGGNTQSLEYARRVAAFDLATMIEADRHNKKIAVGNYFVGTPEAQHVAVMGEMLSYAQLNNHPAIYHAYTNKDSPDSFLTGAEWYAARWIPLFANYPKLRIILGEAARFHAPRFQGRVDMLRLMSELDALNQAAIAQGRVVAAAYWTMGGNRGEWVKDDITHELAAYETWMRG